MHLQVGWVGQVPGATRKNCSGAEAGMSTNLKINDGVKMVVVFVRCEAPLINIWDCIDTSWKSGHTRALIDALKF